MLCAVAATTALAALMLAAQLAGAPVANDAISQTDATDAMYATNVTVVHPSCIRLAQQYNKSLVDKGVRGVSVRGRAARVALLWGSDPARAAAALLLALLRHALRYRRVRMARGPHRTVELAKHVPFDPTATYTDLVVGISTAWSGEAALPWSPSSGASSGLAGPRLAEAGGSAVAARRRLLARLAPAARARPACRHHTRWTFYTNTTALALCGFVGAPLHRGDEPTAEVYGVGDCDATLARLEERAASAKLPLRTHLVDRASLVRRMRTTNDSFLFIDYDIWYEEPNVSFVEPPPCVSVNTGCQQELDSAIALRVADVEILQAYAPKLYQFVLNFKPSPKSLRQILEREVDGEHIEEAACKWALEHKNTDVRSWKLNNYDSSSYWAAVLLCEGDRDIDAYDVVQNVTGLEIYRETKIAGYGILFKRYEINCSDSFNMSMKINEETSYVSMFGLVGVVSAGRQGVAAAEGTAAALHVPLLLVDVPPDTDATASAEATWRVAGRPQHLARALQHFILESGWTRLAVLSQRTKLAESYYAALRDDAKFALHDYSIPLVLTKPDAITALYELQNANARIVYVNADSKAAAVILSAALELKMSYAEGFVWIVRDWQPNTATSNTTHFTISFWSRGEEGISNNSGRPHLRAQLRELYRGGATPPHIASLADALLTLGSGLHEVFRRYPDSKQDLHTAHVIRLLNESLITTPVKGINQFLHYKERTVEERLVFVDEWRGDTFTRRATWRVNASARRRAVRGPPARPAGLPGDDGASRCVARAGDAFQPDCYDAAWASALLLLALAPTALLLGRRALRRRLASLVQAREMEIMARRQHVATVLAAYLVKRDALELREELGAGRFGCVRLALMHTALRSPRYVAAKALRQNAAPAEESEFLREACTIASLNHEHVVRLVGVCIADGPPLVLMELAFFGDLLGYLRARRHLAEGAVCALDEGAPETTSEEATHVSAEALTRLARQAAAALAYLGMRGVVHRDVRAANCLVDARRSLKLADFGMARETVAGVDGAPEYACRRRGLFPVLWMAPESLAHGVFSAASDVWALGVLVLEVVTLGERPFGNMSPLRVLQYVASGGRPPLPLDATPQTRGLARLCWHRVPEQRPSAAELQAYLAVRPRALRPALLSESDEPADADSGFGESPSTELLPPDSPLDSLDHLEVLAVTH